MSDITLRALSTLRAVGLIVAEDTRHTRKLMTHFEIPARLLSYNEHSSARRLEQILETLREQDVALVTDAGTPGISDPGHELVVAALAGGHEVVAIPGPSAALAALVASGLPPDRFLFLGFLPRRSGDRVRSLEAVCDLPYTLIVFEAPHRLVETLQDVHAVLGNRPLAVARELTKLHEEIRRSTVSEELRHWQETKPRGELTLVIQGAELAAPRRVEDAPLAVVNELVTCGLKPATAVRKVARDRHLDSRELYREWHEQDSRLPATGPTQAASTADKRLV
ncbi:MAG: 16S rRNA (cytidine(1402)-2'-O)-methyltransferase [Chloroflexota bacterium]|nr:16S rRNA (cytidine(1402)-2'-O)-methyltransferase [Chloroflexota bacterium]